MQLQRAIGNQATMRFLQNTGQLATSQHPVQRSETSETLRGFSTKLAALIDQLRSTGQDAQMEDRVEALIGEADDIGLDQTNPAMYDKLGTLHEFATGQSQVGLKAILASFDPESMRGDNAFTSAAAASLSPNMGKAGDIGYDEQGFREGQASELGQEAATELVNLEGRDMSREEMVAESRINLVTDKIAQAYAHHMNAHDDTNSPFDKTVLVFMGPEWFFNEGTRPVSRAERDRIIESFRALSLLYPQMVIVPGTILSGDPYYKKKGFIKRKNKFLGFYNNLSNTAPVLWNGNVLKTIDKADIGGDTKEIGDVFGIDQAEAEERFWQGGTESSFFNLGDLRFAIDICVDHFSERAKKELEAAQANDENAQPADVHLVTSAGSQYTPQKGATTSSGVGFGADVGGAQASGKKADGENIASTVLGTDNPADTERPQARKDWFKYYETTPIIHVVDATEGQEIAQEPV